MRLEVTLWEEIWINNCCARSWKGGSENARPEKAGEGSFPSHSAWWQSLCPAWQQWHGDTADVSALHWRAGAAQQGCNAAARACWGLELLCTEVFSIYCNLCPGSGGKVEPPVRAVLGISKCRDCLWVPVWDIRRQSTENICKRHVNRALLKNTCWLFIADWLCGLNLHEQQKGVWWEGT